MSGYSGLTWNERILRCCELAERARLNAESAPTVSASERYLTIAGQWAALAADIERRHREFQRQASNRHVNPDGRTPSSRSREPERTYNRGNAAAT
jgi:hypothetical protein